MSSLPASPEPSGLSLHTPAMNWGGEPGTLPCACSPAAFSTGIPSHTPAHFSPRFPLQSLAQKDGGQTRLPSVSSPWLNLLSGSV